MGWTNYQYAIATLMLITGSLNTLSTKWADNSSAIGADGIFLRKFDHPFLQSVGMFVGEFSCLIVFTLVRFVNRRRNQGSIDSDIGDQTFSRFIFLPAALLDMCGTTLMYVGLNMTFASSFQMLRGAVIIFTALLSVSFLGLKVKNYQWIGMLTIVFGLIVVGLSDVLLGGSHADTGLNGIISGDLLIIMAQVIVAMQMVYEQKYVMKYNIPALQAVGWEGFFGATVLGVLLIPMYYIKIGRPFSTDPDGRMENVKDAFVQMGNNWQLIVAVAGNVLSIAFFNFSGISVMKQMSATTRMVLDSCRTIVIWAVSMSVKWQPFSWLSVCLQLFGFVLLLTGTLVYNDMLIVPALRRMRWCGLTELEDDDDDLLKDHERGYSIYLRKDEFNCSL